ncbi:hypothetical protein VTL71DRAFT_2165 [Oculimacula yallundae]|uniref:Uncharacterized protein n=1 Tax=Oculimacula yallundae TaxID=86028 RepID=A0ABR4CA21_9HELO
MHFSAKLADSIEAFVRHIYTASGPGLTVDFEILPEVARYDEANPNFPSAAYSTSNHSSNSICGSSQINAVNSRETPSKPVTKAESAVIKAPKTISTKSDSSSKRQNISPKEVELPSVSSPTSLTLPQTASGPGALHEAAVSPPQCCQEEVHTGAFTAEIEGNIHGIASTGEPLPHTNSLKRKAEHQYEDHGKHRERFTGWTSNGSPAIENETPCSILEDLLSTNTMKRKRKDQERGSPTPKRQCISLKFCNIREESSAPPPSTSSTNKKLKRKFEGNSEDRAFSKRRCRHHKSVGIEQEIDQILSVPSNNMDGIHERGGDPEGIKEQIARGYRDFNQSNMLDGAMPIVIEEFTPILMPTSETLPPPSIPDSASLTDGTEGSSLLDDIANSSHASSSTFVSNYQVFRDHDSANSLDVESKIDLSLPEIGAGNEDSTSFSSVYNPQMHYNYLHYPGVAPECLTTNPSPPFYGCHTDAITYNAGLGRSSQVQEEAAFPVILNHNSISQNHLPEQSNSLMMESYPDECDYSIAGETFDLYSSLSTAARASTFTHSPDFMHNWQQDGSLLEIAQLDHQPQEGSNSTPLLYEPPHIHGNSSQEPRAYDGQNLGLSTTAQIENCGVSSTEHQCTPAQSPSAKDFWMIDPMLLCIHGPSGNIPSGPFLSNGPLLNDHPLFSFAQPVGYPKTDSPPGRSTSAKLPRYSKLFEPVSAAAYTRDGYKPSLPHILQDQVSLLSPISKRSPRSPIEDYYNEDDFCESVAKVSPGEIRLRDDKVLRKYRVHMVDVLDASSGLRNCVTVIQDEEKRLMAELEHDLEQELELGI